MFSRYISVIAALAVSFLALTSQLSAAQKKAPAPDQKQQALAAMLKASDFMMNKVSLRGGFVWKYTPDLSQRWGEVPARPSQIWVQGATNGVGELFLKAWRTTGNPIFLEYAKRVANAIIQGQYPQGGWHYFIDFDMPGVQKWYDEVASKCFGWEEYYHFYGNCTFDDDTTTSSLRFLLHMYLAAGDPTFLPPLLKGLNFVLEAQYPNGGWPQRYPLSHEYIHDGVPDYTSYYTFNDSVIPNCISLLYEAWEKLGDPRYREAALRGMNFYFISQGPEDQAGWASQYDMELRPAQARSYEPASWSIPGTTGRINDLEKFYKMTGDRRFLRPIPLAITWMERSVVNTDPSKNYTHGHWYEPGTNKPLIAHRDGTNMQNGHYWYDYNFEKPINHMGQMSRLNIPPIRQEYEREKALSPEQAKAEYKKEQEEKDNPGSPDLEKVRLVAGSLDDRGAWITDVQMSQYADPINNPRYTIKGIGVSEFISNMNLLIDYLHTAK